MIKALFSTEFVIQPLKFIKAKVESTSLSLVSVVFVLQSQKHHITTTSLHNWFTRDCLSTESPKCEPYLCQCVTPSHSSQLRSWRGTWFQNENVAKVWVSESLFGLHSRRRDRPYRVILHRKTATQEILLDKKILLKSLFFWFISHEIHFPASSYCA